MAKQVKLNITNVQLAETKFTSTGSIPGWVKLYDSRYFYAAREGMSDKYGADYFMTVIEFSLENVNFFNAEALTLSLTTARKEKEMSNVGRVSAILCNRKLTSTEAYYLQSKEDVENLDGVLGYVNCRAEGKEAEVTYYVLPNTTVDYVFESDTLAQLRAGQKYYLILKRRIGLKNQDDTTGQGGYSEFYNPMRYETKGYIELSYSSEPDWPSKEEIEITPSSIEIIADKMPEQQWQQQFQLQFKQSKEKFTHETLVWAHELYDEIGAMAEDQSLIIKDEEGLFTFSNSIPGNYTANIIATWGEGAAIYSLTASIAFLDQWPYLLDWVIGYNLGLLAPPVVNYCQGKRGFYYYLNPNNYDKTVVLPTPPKGKYFYNCIAQDELVPTIFYFCSSNKPFVYEPIEKYTMLAEGAEAQICSCRPSKEFEWSIPQTIEQDKKLSLTVIWTDTNLMDENGKVYVRPYVPQAYYGQEE